MEAELQTHVAFHLTGRRPAEGLDAVDTSELRPALLARYRDLTRLRYDFPLVLVRDAGVQALSALIDNVLHEVAKGDDVERVTRHVLRQERQIRTLVAEGRRGTLSFLWDTAAGRFSARDDERLQDSLKRARAALKVDGEVVDCDATMPARVITHAWKLAQEHKAKRLNANITRLIVKLSDILRSAFVRSDAGCTADSLEAAFGAAHGAIFDFDAMSKLLTRTVPNTAMAETRRRRIRRLLSVLETQPFVVTSGGKRVPTHEFAFDNCTAAIKAYRERLPGMTELACAIAIAELEIKGEYNEASHDDYFESYGTDGLDPDDLALFPDYLICVNSAILDAVENATLMEILSAGLPMKVLVQTDDILNQAPLGDGHLGFEIRSRQLANMAIGMNYVYVLQSTASNLVQMRARLEQGLAYAGPALFSVFSGASATSGDLPPYLVAAAAMESRAFPAFTFDPAAGADWATRFDLEGNPQVERDWPVQSFAYETAEHQRKSDEIAFTLVDFVACDRRYARHFARVPREAWSADMVPVSDCIPLPAKGLPDKVPSLLMVDTDNVLQKLIVDDKLMREARRGRTLWHSLQELGGIHNSHAKRLLEEERKARAERDKAAAEVVAATPAAAASAPAAAVEAAAEPSSDDAHIETARCTSCNECTKLNDKMFRYNEDKQAYIANPDAGTYAQLVEAAETCQVSIIHPGKPRNPDEPGLAELMQRAEAFA